MSSEQTTNYGLPQYCPGDHPDFLTEINKAYMTIDSELHSLRSAVSNDAQMMAAANATIEALSKQILLLTERVEALEKEDKQNE